MDKNIIIMIIQQLNMINLDSPKEIQKKIAQRFKQQRLILNLSRKELSNKSVVNEHTLKKFETTGDINFKNLIFLAMALDKIYDIKNILKIIEPNNIKELKNKNKNKNKMKTNIKIIKNK